MTDPELVEYENSLGSDVARNQHMDHEGNTDRECSNESPANSIRYSVVPQKEEAYLTQQEEDFRHRAFKRTANLNDPDTAESDDFCTWTLDDLQEFMDTYDTHVSKRQERPFSDFIASDANLTTSFPHIFMLGKAYGKSVPNMSLPLRQHLLYQFTMIPATDRRLLGYLFDVMQRSRVLKSVAGYVDGNAPALETMTKLLSSKEERRRLKDAMDHPHLTSSKKLLKTYLGLLRYVGRNVPYGALEGRQMKHRCLALTHRYAEMNCFFTLSPNNLGNPRSLRLSCKTINNNVFPAVFDENCAWGDDGIGFLKYLAENHSTVLSEGDIVLPEEEWPEKNKHTPVYHGEGFRCLRVALRQRFPLMTAFAITVHKAEGATMEKVIVAMSKGPVHKCNFTYEQVHVAFSRVTEGKNLKLLLTGGTEPEQWKSISFVMDLRQDPSIQWYFMGFRQRLRPGQGDPNVGWIANAWTTKRANNATFLQYLRRVPTTKGVVVTFHNSTCRASIISHSLCRPEGFHYKFSRCGVFHHSADETIRLSTKQPPQEIPCFKISVPQRLSID